MEVNTVMTKKNPIEVWNKCLSIIKDEVDSQSFQTWFAPIKPIKINENVLTIGIDNHFVYEWLEAHHIHLLRRVIDDTLGTNGRLEYLLIEEPETPEINNLTNRTSYPQSSNGQQKSIGKTRVKELLEQQKSNFYADTTLNIHYTFDNFIEGDCNRLARSAGQAVAENPGSNSFNPLMLYGGVGLGKTHLIQAIGNYINLYGSETASEKVKKKKKEVVYISADKFTNQLVDHIKTNSVDVFNSFYMHIDVLMIDDIQFLSGKEKTQEIFFHIFNELRNTGKQIVITSDKPPTELQGLTDRLLSRFKSGMIADLQQPDLETRMAIIQQKTQEENFTLDKEIVEYLANSIDTNVRELEGAITSLIAQSTLGGKIDLEVAKNVVKQIVQSPTGKEIGIEEIQKVVSRYFDLNVEDLKAKTRKKEIVIARQIAMFFSKEMTPFSLKSIGYQFGGRDHSTVIHAIRSVDNYLEEKREFRMHIEDIRKQLKG